MPATIDTLIADLVAWTDTDSTVLPPATCAEFINSTVRRLERTRPYRGTFASVDLTIGTTGSVPLPPDFVGEFGVWLHTTTTTSPSVPSLREVRRLAHKRAWYSDPTQETGLARDPYYTQVAAPWGSLDDGITNYWIEGDALTIQPPPAAATTFQLDYARELPELIAGTGQTHLFLRLFPDVVRLGALREAYYYLHEYETAAQYEQLFQLGVKETIQRDEATTAAGAPPIKGR